MFKKTKIVLLSCISFILINTSGLTQIFANSNVVVNENTLEIKQSFMRYIDSFVIINDSNQLQLTNQEQIINYINNNKSQIMNELNITEDVSAVEIMSIVTNILDYTNTELIKEEIEIDKQTKAITYKSIEKQPKPVLKKADYHRITSYWWGSQHSLNKSGAKTWSYELNDAAIYSGTASGIMNALGIWPVGVGFGALTTFTKKLANDVSRNADLFNSFYVDVNVAMWYSIYR